MSFLVTYFRLFALLPTKSPEANLDRGILLDIPTGGQNIKHTAVS